MTSSVDSQTESERAAGVWLKPDQVEQMRTATVEVSPSYQSQRNEAIIALLYDSGLRVGELVQLNTEMLDLDDRVLMLPGTIQKEYPNENDPDYTEIELDTSTVRLLRQYLNNRDDNSDALFPSRQSSRMTTESVRNVVSRAAQAAEVTPYTRTGQGDPGDVTPHSLRHSVAYRMLNVEDGNTLYDVRNRLRHRRLETTEQVYDHFDRV